MRSWVCQSVVTPVPKVDYSRGDVSEKTCAPALIFRLLLLLLILPTSFLRAAEPAEPATRPAMPNLRVAWRYALGSPTDSAVGHAGNRLVIGTREGIVHAVSAEDGKGLWKCKLSSSVTSGPAFSPTAVFLGTEAGELHAISVQEGKLQWAFKTGGRIVGRPAIAGNRVVFGSYDNHVYCVDLDAGKELWRYKTTAQVHAAITLAGDLAITGGCDGFLRAIGLNDGKERWNLDLGGPIATTPALQASTVFAATMSGRVVAVSTDGNLQWSVEPAPEAGGFTASPAVDAEKVSFVTDQGELIVLSIGQGEILAKARVSEKAPLARAGGYLLAGTDQGQVLLLDPATGRTLRKATLGGTVSSLLPTPDGIIVLTSEGTLWSLQLR